MGQNVHKLTADELATIDEILDRGNDAEVKPNKAGEIIIYEVERKNATK